MSQIENPQDVEPMQECPICGQDYDHKRKERTGERTSIRSDAKECRTSGIGGERQVYVHFPNADPDNGKSRHEELREEYGTLNPAGRLMCSEELEEEVQRMLDTSRAGGAEIVRCGPGKTATVEFQFHVDEFHELWPWGEEASPE